MLSKTRGIVLSYTKFKESSIVVRVFTERYGLLSYIVNGVRSIKAKRGMALYQPLTLLDMVVYHKGSDKVNRISELKCAVPFTSIPFDIKKSSIAIFITEVLTKVLKEGEENPDEFDYVFHSIEYLDAVPDNFENFHLEFMVGISRFLGFGLLSGHEAVSQLGLNNNDTRMIAFLDDISVKSRTPPISNALRKKTLDFLINYFQHHLDYGFQLKSAEILQQIFS